MASNGYDRQGSFTDGDVIEAVGFNNEFNQIAQAFHEVDGHTHDGSDGQGSPIPLIKDVTTGTVVTAGASSVTVDIDGLGSIFTLTRGAGGEALLNGVDTATYSVDGHTHVRADITDFAHTHSISEITNLNAVLASKYSPTNPPSFTDLDNTAHTHVIADVTGLQTELNAKYSATNPVDWGDIANKPTVPSEVHTHVISDIDGLQAALDGKEPVFTKNSGFNKALGTTAGTVAEGNHTHTPSQVGLGNVDNTSDLSKPVSTATQVALNGKANSSHTHSISNVTNLQSSLDSKLEAFFVVLTASQTLARTAPREIYLIDTLSAVSYTLDESTYQVGDVVEILVVNEGHAGVTVTTDSGVIKVPDFAQSAASHTLTDLSAHIKLYKLNATNWSLMIS